MAPAHEPENGFFQTLGSLARSQRENQLSRTFKACFDASPTFRTRLLQLLARTCDVPVRAKGEWECLAELGNKGGGRFDVVLRCPSQPRFVLESKVESTLTLAQLQKYKSKKRGEHHLIAVTKHRPEVPRRVLRREGIHTIRWQDIHRAVTDPAVSGGRDAFITSSFAEYLEGEDMAYRIKLSPTSLVRAGRLLAIFGAKAEDTAPVSGRDAFASLDSLAHLLLDIAYDAEDEFPEFAKWNRSGPSYCKWEGAPVIFAGFWRGRNGRPPYREVAWGFWPKDRSLRFTVWFIPEKDDDIRESRSFRMSELKSRDASLDRDRVWHVVRNQLRAWKFRVTP